MRANSDYRREIALTSSVYMQIVFDLETAVDRP